MGEHWLKGFIKGLPCKIGIHLGTWETPKGMYCPNCCSFWKFRYMYKTFTLAKKEPK